eukprot:748043-Hanusia_phi.AAC.5
MTLVGCDVNETDEAGNGALHYAGINADVMRLLISHTADVNITNKVGATALHEAAAKEYIDACKMLLCCGCHVDIRDKMGMKAEDRCRAMSKMKAFHLLRSFKELRDRGLQPQDAMRQFELDQELHDALLSLGMDHDVSRIMQLLRSGADVNVLNLESHQRPLHIAVIKNSLPAVHLLLQYGAVTNFTQPGENKLNALSLALVKRNYEKGQSSVDLRVTNPQGMSTVLHIAVLNNDVLAVKFLLDYGADPDQNDKYGRSALDYAQGRTQLCQQEMSDMVEVFAAHQLDLTRVEETKNLFLPTREWSFGLQSTERLNQLLGEAAMLGDCYAAVELCNLGAEANAQLSTWEHGYVFVETPLSIAAARGSERFASLIIRSYGADVSLAGSTYGWLPIHVAAFHGNGEVRGGKGEETEGHAVNVLRLLISQGANLNPRVMKGNSPYAGYTLEAARARWSTDGCQQGGDVGSSVRRSLGLRSHVIAADPLL